MDIWAFIPIAAILGLWAFLISVSQAKARVRELQIRERIAMIEKGLMPAPEVDPRGFERAMGQDGTRYRHSANRHRSAGITLIGVGLGLMVMIAFAGEHPQQAVGVGGFIIMIGGAFLVNSMFDQRRLEDEMSRRTSRVSPAAADGPKTE